MTHDPHTWHPAEGALSAYAQGSALPVPGASVEAHLMVCADCRERFAPLVPVEPLAQVWEAVRARVETPRRSAAEQFLGWLGLSGESARLMAAVPAFAGAWLLGILGVTVFAGAAAMFSGALGVAIFLLVAPLAPVAGVAASFGGDADPSHELVTVTPHPAVRLLLLRTAGVLATSAPVAIMVGLALPGPSWLAVAWLAPAAAGVTTTLALSPLLGSNAAAATVGATWSVAVVWAVRVRDPLALVEPVMQLFLVTLILAGVAVLVLRHHSLDHLERTS
ncbi:MAG TPA: hypothetical protein VFD59_04065 [Nocardioidaceae bacterium]|nr:hypothetical protein [Nocardioidaceae bacterium]